MTENRFRFQLYFCMAIATIGLIGFYSRVNVGSIEKSMFFIAFYGITHATVAIYRQQREEDKKFSMGDIVSYQDERGCRVLVTVLHPQKDGSIIGVEIAGMHKMVNLQPKQIINIYKHMQ